MCSKDVYLWLSSSERFQLTDLQQSASFFSASPNESEASEDRDSDWTSSNALMDGDTAATQEPKESEPWNSLNRPEWFYTSPDYSYKLGRAWGSGAASFHLGLWPRSSSLFSKGGIWHLQARWHEWDCARSSVADPGKRVLQEEKLKFKTNRWILYSNQANRITESCIKISVYPSRNLL